jgi:DMSO/TMAO reductase YedYZ molybdopterin-dependent catalytic subunit
VTRRAPWLRPAAVDWGILGAVVVLVATGLLGLVTGRPSGAWVFVVHGVAGLALVALLALKLRRVAGRLAPERLTRTRALSAALAAVTLAALTTGVGWAFGAGLPVSFWTLLNVHILFGLAVVPLAAWHLRHRLRPASSVQKSANRRTALRYFALVTGAALVWRVQRALDGVLGPDRRFTGSREKGSDAGNRFPVTSWVADDPDPVDLDRWSLTVGGRTDRTLDLGRAALDPGSELRATLDCTSGWYSVHDWQGLRVGDLLDAAGADPGANWVQFRSVTGYRWSLPVEEARDALLATHVDGAELAHGHGRPVRLVAPGRRGFQWVKWVEAVVVTERRDRSEWVAIFVSGIEA